jgi:hypothetical protein
MRALEVTGRTNTIVLLFAVVGLMGCHESQRIVPTRMTDSATLEALYQDIYAFTEDRSCQDPAECAALPLGSSPCGGPWSYLVYSRSTVNETELLAMTLHLAAYETLYHQESRASAPCVIANSPSPDCVNSVCIDTSQP